MYLVELAERERERERGKMPREILGRGTEAAFCEASAEALTSKWRP
jgi:hypothetical protein